MNIELQTKKGTKVTIVHDGGKWIYPAGHHDPEYIESTNGNRVIGPIRASVEANERRMIDRSTYVRAEADRWARQIVDYYERMGY